MPFFLLFAHTNENASAELFSAMKWQLNQGKWLLFPPSFFSCPVCRKISNIRFLFGFRLSFFFYFLFCFFAFFPGRVQALKLNSKNFVCTEAIKPSSVVGWYCRRTARTLTHTHVRLSAIGKWCSWTSTIRYFADEVCVCCLFPLGYLRTKMCRKASFRGSAGQTNLLKQETNESAERERERATYSTWRRWIETFWKPENGFGTCKQWQSFRLHCTLIIYCQPSLRFLSPAVAEPTVPRGHPKESHGTHSTFLLSMRLRYCIRSECLNAHLQTLLIRWATIWGNVAVISLFRVPTFEWLINEYRSLAGHAGRERNAIDCTHSIRCRLSDDYCCSSLLFVDGQIEIHSFVFVLFV